MGSAKSMCIVVPPAAAAACPLQVTGAKREIRGKALQEQDGRPRGRTVMVSEQAKVQIGTRAKFNRLAVLQSLY
jgi:hypothetical protein